MGVVFSASLDIFFCWASLYIWVIFLTDKALAARSPWFAASPCCAVPVSAWREGPFVLFEVCLSFHRPVPNLLWHSSLLRSFDFDPLPFSNSRELSKCLPNDLVEGATQVLSTWTSSNGPGLFANTWAQVCRQETSAVGIGHSSLLKILFRHL